MPPSLDSKPDFTSDEDEKVLDISRKYRVQQPRSIIHEILVYI